MITYCQGKMSLYIEEKERIQTGKEIYHSKYVSVTIFPFPNPNQEIYCFRT